MAGGMKMTISLKNLDLTVEQLEGFGKSLATGMSGTMEEVGVLLTKFFASTPVATRGATYGSEWADYKDAKYADKKGKSGLPMMIGFGEDHMINHFGSTVTPFSVTVRNDKTVRSKTGEYNLLEIHQKGLGHMPPRMIMELTDALKVSVREKIREGVLAKLAESKR